MKRSKQIYYNNFFETNWNIKSHFLRNSGKAWKWYTQIFFIFKYFVQDKENRHLWNFFLKIPIHSWEIGYHILALFRQNWLCWKSFGSTFIPWKKICVQAMAWGWVMAWKSLFVPKVLLKITHSGVGLRSDIRRGGFLASSNIVL